MPEKKRTKAERKYYDDLLDNLLEMTGDIVHPELVPGMLPPKWQDLEIEPVSERVKITLLLDKDVTKFFRGLGPGYQSKVNLVLRTYMLAYLSGTVGRASDTVRDVHVEELTEGERHDLELERRYAEMLKGIRERRARTKEMKRRWDD